MRNMILVAGATGNLGMRIVKALVEKNAEVKVLIRPKTDTEIINALFKIGAKIHELNHWNQEEIAAACDDVACVVSVLAGLKDVIIDAQKILLDAAVLAGVQRFIPSDYSLDFTNFKQDENRNLDLRREFHTYLDQQNIRATSVFNGAFMELILDEMPLIVFKPKLVIYWGKADYKWGFTAMDDVAKYTANVALDPNTPRYLNIAGDQISPREVKVAVSEVTKKSFTLIRLGGKTLLGIMIKIAKKVSPAENELYPAWQGMQYMHNMIDPRSEIKQLDNNRYAGMSWFSVKDMLYANKV